jgi:single-strand DNA-binding protein
LSTTPTRKRTEVVGEPQITVTGNVAGDVQLRYSPAGVAVAQWTVASTPRDKNRDTGKYEDAETLWVRCTAFRSDAEHAAESLMKGTRCIVSGKLRQETWTDKEGKERTTLKLLVDEVGASIKWADVTIRKPERGSETAKRPGPVDDDPWAAAPPEDEPPF